jgi:predicted dithiol-disulfide oxidoreductase (DUF899 family)
VPPYEDEGFALHAVLAAQGSGRLLHGYVLHERRPFPVEALIGLAPILLNPRKSARLIERCFLHEGDSAFHTYSAYARGPETIGGSFYFLDETALGRQEDWEEPKGKYTN